MCRFRRNAPGFTLLEVLVALILFSLFAITSYRALNTVLEAEAHSRVELARWQKLEKIFSRIEADLQDAVFVTAAPGQTYAGFATERSDSGELAFSMNRLVPDDVAGGVQRIQYRVTSRQLSRTAWSSSHSESDTQPVLLLEGVEQAGFRYMDASGHWQLGWGILAGDLPRAVEVVFALPDGAALRRVFRLR